MRQDKKIIILLAVTAAFAVGGCGNQAPQGIVIGDSSAIEMVKKDVTITEALDNQLEFWGHPPFEPQRRIGRYQLSPEYKRSDKVMGLSGGWIHISADADGLKLTNDSGDILFQCTSKEPNFTISRLSTSNPGLRLWLIQSSTRYPSAFWVIGETKEAITTYLTEEDFQKAGLGVENPGQERISVKQENGTLVFEKSHMESITTAATSGGKLEKAKVNWKKDGSAALVWDNAGGTFTLGKVPEKKTGSFLDSLFGPSETVAENKILSIEKWHSMVNALAGEKHPSLEMETSNGKKMVFLPFRDFFQITNEDETAPYYTSETSSDMAGRFLVSEIKVSDPDTRLWSVTNDSNSNVPIQSGYWLIGEHKGIFKVYLTPAMMAEAGIPLGAQSPGQSHCLFLTVQDGVIQGEYYHEFWPSRQSHAAAYWILDKTFTIGWDKKQQSFVVENVKTPEEITYCLRGAKLDENPWKVMTDEQKQRYEQQKKSRW